MRSLAAAALGLLLLVGAPHAVLAQRGDREPMTHREPRPGRASREAAIAADPDEPPTEIEIDEVPAAPVGYHLAQRARPVRAVMGGVLFAAAWAPGLALGIGAAGCEKRSEIDDRCMVAGRVVPLAVPLVGPMIALPACAGAFDSGGSALCAATLVGDSALQVLGLYLLVSGARPRPVFVRNPGAKTEAVVSLGARATSSGIALTVLGAF